MAIRILQVCPHCGNSTFIHRELEEQDHAFECLACGDIVYPEDLNTKVIEDSDLQKHGLIELEYFKEVAEKAQMK